MKRGLLVLGLGILGVFLYVSMAAAHCEIPCGIYDDQARIKLMLEHVTTIEKSMKQIIEIDKAVRGQSNQQVRWIMNKEKHADELQEIVCQYFMTQRIKVDTKQYDKKLAALHQMLVAAMKCKQSTDLQQVLKLRALIAQFEILYFTKS